MYVIIYVPIPADTRGHVSVIKIFDNSVVDTVNLKGSGRGFVAITSFRIGEGNGRGGAGGGSCSLVSSTASNAYLPVYLLIPAFVLIIRLWRRRTNQKRTSCSKASQI